MVLYNNQEQEWMHKIIRQGFIKSYKLGTHNYQLVWGTKPKLSYHTGFSKRICYGLSQFQDAHNKKIKEILAKTKINYNNQSITILDSKLISSYNYEEIDSKIVIQVDTNKDFVKIKNYLKNIFTQEGYANVEVKLCKKDKKIFQRKGNLMGIKKIIAVSSCKGGVGKSTIAVNIAFQLQLQGFKVGIFDADIHGPSLPTLVNKEGEFLQNSNLDGNIIIPKIADGIKCMSFGFVSNQPATIRGPMASSIVSQLLLNTQWNNLDFLIVDMPPGTGDINVTLCDLLKIDGAVVVTTPQYLSFIDVLKGLQMFKDFRVRILTVIQNMSYYSCSKCETKDEIFGKGHSKFIIDQLGIQNSYKIPLMSQISKHSDSGVPIVKSSSKNGIIKQIYQNICNGILRELEKPLKKGGVFYDTTERFIIAEQGKIKKKMKSVYVRSKCRCPQCYNQSAGEQLIKQSQIDPEIYPVKIQERGNYAVGITWSDGHKNSIFSYKRLFSDQLLGK